MRGFKHVDTICAHGRIDDVALPLHATMTAAGYDFYATADLVIPPGENASFTTDVKAYMQPDEMLMLVVRSSIGIKRNLMLANTIGIIDSDYYDNSDNEGNISICLRNIGQQFALTGFEQINSIDGKVIDVPKIVDLRAANTVNIKKGERIVQGIFVKILSADGEHLAVKRVGGIGSSGEGD